jgi:hypothetical protein
MDKKLCGATTKRDCLWGRHQCGKKDGHVGRHRCRHQAESKGFRVLKKPVPCNVQWQPDSIHSRE